jgi:hypothetical protein
MKAPGPEAGIAYLLRCQRDDGHWVDYDLPTGRSDAWVTAYVGLALADVSAAHDDARAAAGRAAAWLAGCRAYPTGWGYNDITGPDADSTGYALRLLRRAGLAVGPEHEAWLLGHWRAEAGFATYQGPGGWGLAHPDVTPNAYAALSRPAQRRLRGEMARVLRATRAADGTWPAYWWRTRHASTWMNACLARRLLPDLPPAPPAIETGGDRAVLSALDLAFVAANAWLARGDAGAAPLLDLLRAMQAPDGSWPGAPNLRVAHHDAADPWGAPEGALFTDGDHLITTASAVRLLARIAP